MDPKLEAALGELTDQVMDWEGVAGTAIGEKDGKACLTVYLSDAKVKKRVPRRVGGYPVVVEVSGPFRRL
mgnify:CR=1 FL=1